MFIVHTSSPNRKTCLPEAVLRTLVRVSCVWKHKTSLTAKRIPTQVKRVVLTANLDAFCLDPWCEWLMFSFIHLYATALCTRSSQARRDNVSRVAANPRATHVSVPRIIRWPIIPPDLAKQTAHVFPEPAANAFWQWKIPPVSLKSVDLLNVAWPKERKNLSPIADKTHLNLQHKQHDAVTGHAGDEVPSRVLEAWRVFVAVLVAEILVPAQEDTEGGKNARRTDYRNRNSCSEQLNLYNPGVAKPALCMSSIS